MTEKKMVPYVTVMKKVPVPLKDVIDTIVGEYRVFALQRVRQARLDGELTDEVLDRLALQAVYDWKMGSDFIRSVAEEQGVHSVEKQPIDNSSYPNIPPEYLDYVRSRGDYDRDQFWDPLTQCHISWVRGSNGKPYTLLQPSEVNGMAPKYMDQEEYDRVQKKIGRFRSKPFFRAY